MEKKKNEEIKEKKKTKQKKSKMIKYFFEIYVISN